MRTFCFLTAFLLFTSSGFGQSGKDNPSKPFSVKLPKGNDAWVIRVERSGGITGGSEDVTLDSSGTVRCGNTDLRKHCPATLTEAELKVFEELVTRKIPDSTSSLGSVCNDCHRVRITLQHRDSKGKVRKYYAFWIGSPGPRIASEVTELAGKALALVR